MHVFDWPAGGQLIVPRLADKPAKAFLRADGRSLDATVSNGQLVVTVPAETPDKIATVVALDTLVRRGLR